MDAWSAPPMPDWAYRVHAPTAHIINNHEAQAHMGASILRALRDDTQNNKIEIVCGEKSLKVHKAILRVCSKVLYSMVNSSFMEGRTGIINLSSAPYKGDPTSCHDGDDPELVEEMLHFFYNLKLSTKCGDTWEDSVGRAKALIYLARLYALADKYEAELLMEAIVPNFENIKFHMHPRDLIESFRIIEEFTFDTPLKALIIPEISSLVSDESTLDYIQEMFDNQPSLGRWLLKMMLKHQNNDDNRKVGVWTRGSHF